MKKVLIVSPAFNEEKVLPEFIAAFLKLKAQVSAYTDLRLLLVNDGSTDRSLQLIKDMAARNPNCIYYVSFFSNFGHQAALMAGLNHGRRWADAIVTMDSDLEHPLDLVPALIENWGGTKTVVNTRRRKLAELPLRKRFFSSLFYFIAVKLTHLDISAGQADFRLWDAKFLRSLPSGLENLGSIRLFAAWVPGPKDTIEYNQNFTRDRKSRFTFKKNLELAIISIVRFSDLPLRSISFLGSLGLLFSLVYAIYILIRVSHGFAVPGWASILLTIIFMSCLQLLSIGIIATYLQHLVFSKDLPQYLISELAIPDDET